MRLKITPDNQYVEVIPESKKDFRVLKEFPGLQDIKRRKMFSAKTNVCKNVIDRLKTQLGTTVKGSAEVVDLYKSEFKLREIPKAFHYFTSPLPHQELALRFLYTNGGGGLLLDPGLGKTKVVLDYIALSGFKKSLIVCPKALLFVWQDEVKFHRPDLKVHVVESMTWHYKIKNLEEKNAVLEEQDDEDSQKKFKRNLTTIRRMKREQKKDEEGIRSADIVVVNYDKAVRGQLELVDEGFDFMAVDEGLVKDHTTSRTKAVTLLSKHVSSTVIMSGTLVNNSPTDIFSPVQILEPSLVGRSFTKFRDRYCHMVPVRDDRGNIKSQFAASFKHVDEARSILQAVSIVMRKEEWLDLPPKKFIPVECTPTEEQSYHIAELAANYITKIDGEYLEVESPLTVMAKLYQMSNGFVYIDQGSQDEVAELFGREGSSKDRKTFFFKDNPKISRLNDLHEKTLSKRKYILWYNMDAEYEIISQWLDEKGISYESIRGGEKKTGDKVRGFNEDPSTQVLVCQARSVNYGITVLGTSPEKLDKDIEILPDVDTKVYTQVFFSINFSLEVFLQQQDRIHRIGQTHPCEYYLLINDTPVERKVHTAIENKKELREKVLIDILHQLQKEVMV